MENSEEYIRDKEKSTRVWIYSIIFVLFIILSVCLVFKYVYSRSNSEETINYSENGTINYIVSLKDNDYYESDYVDQNKIYIASLINKVEIDFNYDFNVDKDINSEFAYDIYSELIIKDGTSDKEYIHKKYDIDSTSKKMENVKKYNINKHVSIDYDYYNKLASKFKGDYGVDTASILRVKFVIKNDNISLPLEDSNMYVDIPLSERAISISTYPIGLNKYNKILKNDKVIIVEKSYIVLIVAIVLMMTVILILLANSTREKRSKYQKVVAKLLREYDRMIVEVSIAPDLENEEKIIHIFEFKELLDVRDNLKLPIMYYEKTRKKEALFFINDDEHLYLYVIKSEEID